MGEDQKPLFRIRSPPRRVPKKYQEELNEQQLQAVTHGDRAALIIAGPGSGKTRVLTYRVAWLIENGAKADSIVLVTFTKKAAQEMIGRVDDLTEGGGDAIQAGTFHHVANVFLRKYAPMLNSDYKRNYTILDRSDSVDLMKLVVANLIPKEEKQHYPNAKTMTRILSRAINVGQTIAEVCETERIEGDKANFVKKAINIYRKRKREMNVMDFDDLLINFLLLLQDDTLGMRVKQRVKHVLVDEYQDVNTIQAEIVMELGKNAESVTVVGDDAQSIYAFRGAEPQHMFDFPKIFPEAVTYRLEINYRSTPEILEFVNASIAHNKNQFEKTLVPTRESGNMPFLTSCDDARQEADLTCSRVLDLLDEGVALSDQAVLFRAKYHSLEVERSCMKYQIPYEMRAGRRFFERAHIKDAMAYLVLLVNPSDYIQWLRVFTMHYQVGNVTAGRIIDIIRESDNPLEKFVNTNLTLAMRGKNVRQVGMTNLLKLQKFLREALLEADRREDYDVSHFLNRIIQYLEPLVEKRYSNHEDRILDLQELVRFSSRYSDPNELLSDVLTMYNLVGVTRKGSEKPPDMLVLSTIHQAKGLEWDAVYIIRLVEGGLPHSLSLGDPEEIEEERRLLYVASTRAKDYLFLTYPSRQTFWLGDEIGNVSRFIEEIGEDGVFEQAGLSLEAPRKNRLPVGETTEKLKSSATAKEEQIEKHSKRLYERASIELVKYLVSDPKPHHMDDIAAYLNLLGLSGITDGTSLKNFLMEISTKNNRVRFDGVNTQYQEPNPDGWEYVMLLETIEKLDASQGKDCWWPISKVRRKMQEQGFEAEEIGYANFQEFLDKAETRNFVLIDVSAIAKWSNLT